VRARVVVPASVQAQCPVGTPRCHTRASWKSFRRPPPALAMSARISDATRHRAAVNVITPVNVPVIDPTIGQVDFPRRISVADARPPPRSAQRRSATVCRRSSARRMPSGGAHVGPSTEALPSTVGSELGRSFRVNVKSPKITNLTVGDMLPDRSSIRFRRPS